MKLSAIFCLIAFEVSSTAAVYYVDATGGSDGNDGLSSGAAWQTITQAETHITAGDSVLFKRGETWSGKFSFPTDRITLDAYGSGNLPIIDGGNTNRKVLDTGNFVGTETRHLHVKNAGGGTGALWGVNAGTNTIEDCTLEHSASDAGASAGSDAFIIVRRCTISDTFDDGVTLHSTARALVESCTFTNCSQAINNSGTDMRMTINDCSFINNATDIGPLSATPGAIINRCRFYGRSDGASLKFLDSSAADVTLNYCIFDGSQSASVSEPSISVSTPVYFNNCVFYGGGNGTISVASTGSLIITNCIFSEWWRAAYIYSGGSFAADHCIFYSVSVKDVPQNTAEVSTSDPLFVNAATGDFHLTPGSPALNSGIYTGQLLDLDRKPIRNPPDLGAYEYMIVSRALNLRAGFLKGK